MNCMLHKACGCHRTAADVLLAAGGDNVTAEGPLRDATLQIKKPGHVTGVLHRKDGSHAVVLVTCHKTHTDNGKRFDSGKRSCYADDISLEMVPE